MALSVFTFLFKDFEFFKLAYDIRDKVFIQEQNVPKEEELDGLDPACIHFLGLFENKPVVTARVRYIDKDTWKVERVAVIKENRGQGFGKEVMENIENEAKKKKVSKLILNSQKNAIDFYKSLGYKSISDEYFYEAGIPHIKMEKILKESQN
jgi:predicted GNAT family N-acyltransferase